MIEAMQQTSMLIIFLAGCGLLGLGTLMQHEYVKVSNKQLIVCAAVVGIPTVFLIVTTLIRIWT